jgi:DNA ligase (NAD+)
MSGMTPTSAPLAAALIDHDTYLQAVAAARTAADAYYGAGESGLDDETYDRLLRAITGWEGEHPKQTAENSPTRQVAAGVTSGEVAHRERMLSLGNVFSAEELTAWRAVLDPVTVAGTTIT